ncbi:MAG: TonB-dependent receptor, partial [Caulobacteraceae bacterium]
MRTNGLAAASSVALLVGAAPAWAASEGAITEVVVTARRLDQAREAIQPNLGATSYTLPSAFVQTLPGGENTGLNQVLLQAPGVTQDSFGQLHVRGDHANLQYRLNGVILPEGLAAFGQVLTPRLADRTELITGALPAQYGLRTAGVVNITTKSGAYQNGGEASVYGGAHGEYQPSLQYGASLGGTNLFGSVSYRRSQLGVESPDGGSTPNHDRTDQAQGFVYLDHALGASDRIALILGVSNQRFQIPNPRGLQPDLGLTVNGAVAYPSEALGSTQREGTTFAIASLLHAAERGSVQASLSARYSTLTYRPSGPGELLYNGISQYAAKRDTAVGLQVDGAYNLTATHTLRAGGLLQVDRAASSTLSSVLPVGDNGQQTSDRPLSIADKSGRTAWTGSLYLQDEWRPLTGVTINYGLRYDRTTAPRHEQQLSPRLNVVWEPAEGTTLHAGYARYFTPAPFGLIANTTIAKFAGTTAAAISDLNNAPYAERTDYLDIGAHQHL